MAHGMREMAGDGGAYIRSSRWRAANSEVIIVVLALLTSLGHHTLDKLGATRRVGHATCSCHVILSPGGLGPRKEGLDAVSVRAAAGENRRHLLE
jgi:hypothetical protein